MAGLGASFGGLLGNPVLEQIALWQVGGSLIGAALGPYMQALTNEVQQLTPLVPLSPADAAEAVLRTVWSEDQGAHEASFAGVNRERFDVLYKLAGNAPAPEALAVALRRELIDQSRYELGIAQGRLRNEWGPIIRALAVQQPSPEAMLAAYLEGQLSEGEARARFAKLGGDPDYFDILYHTQGQAPTPTQALDLLNRGVIPEGGTGPDATSYTQAFLEGPWRNKWLGPFLALRRYIPPPRTVTAMYKEGSYSAAQAADRLRMNGLNEEDIAAYLSSGSSQSTSSTKDLGQSTVLTLYRDRIITRAQAATFLQALNYAANEAEYILEIADLQLVQRYLESAVSRVHTLYVGRKLSRAAAETTLVSIGVDGSNIPDLLTLWGYEREANVRLLTPTDVASAFKKGLVDEPTALADLAGLGYLPHDAWLYLSVHAGALQSPAPPIGATSPTGG